MQSEPQETSYHHHNNNNSNNVVLAAEIPSLKSELSDLCGPVKQLVDEIPTVWPLPRIPFAIMIVGRPESGKTTLWNNFLIKEGFYNQKFHKVHIYSGSSQTLNVKKLQLPEDRIHKGFDIEHFKANVDKSQDKLQSEIYGDQVSQYLAYRAHMMDPDSHVEVSIRKPPKVHQLFIFDDVLNALKTYEEEISEAILNRRHTCCSFIICTQKYTRVPLSIRNGLSGIFVYHTNNGSELEILWKEQFKIARQTFHELLAQVWKVPKSFLYIKMDDVNYINKPFFRNFDHLDILNVDCCTLANGTAPRSVANVLERQKVLAPLFEPPEDVTPSGLKVSECCSVEDKRNLAKVMKYTPEGALSELEKIKKKHHGRLDKRRGRPPGSKNKPKELTWHPKRGLMLVSKQGRQHNPHNRASLLPPDAFSLGLYAKNLSSNKKTN